MRVTVLVTLATLLPAGSALADGFKVTTMDRNGQFLGCIATNEAVGISVAAYGAEVSILTTAAAFPIAEGEAVTGSWLVDGAKPVAFATKAPGPRTAPFDLPNTAEAVTAVTTGKALAVTANGAEASFSLAGMSQAFGDLINCMETKKAP